MRATPESWHWGVAAMLDRVILDQGQPVRVGAFEDGTTVRIDDLVVAVVDQHQFYEWLPLRGQVISSDKPISVQAEGAALISPPLAWADTRMLSVDNRNAPSRFFIYPTEADCTITVSYDGVGSQQFECPVGVVTLCDMTAPTSGGIHFYQIDGTTPFVAAKQTIGSSGDRETIPPPSTDVLHPKNDSSPKVTKEIDLGNGSGSTKFVASGGTSQSRFLSNDGRRMVTSSIGDGAGGDSEFGIPRRCCGSKYLITQNIYGFNLLSVDPGCLVRVEYFSPANEAEWITYDVYDLSEATPELPHGRVVGSSGTVTPFLVHAGDSDVIWRFTADSNKTFAIRSNNQTDDEWVLLDGMNYAYRGWVSEGEFVGRPQTARVASGGGIARGRRGWRYLAQRLTGDGVGEFMDMDLPLEDVEIETVLSGHNSLSASIEPKYRRLLAEDGLPTLAPWQTAIYAENDGDIRGAGILIDSEFEGPQWNLECIGFTGYAQDMPYVGGWYGVEIDPLDVVRHIWEHIQAQPRGNLGLELSNLKTGLEIGTTLEQGEYDTEEGPLNFESGPYKLAWYQDHDLASNVDKLAADTPFDYVEKHQWIGDAIQHRLEFGYPKIGRKREDLRFVFGENIQLMPSVTRSGDHYATEAMVLGAGEGRTMKRGASFARRGGLRRVAVVSDPSIRSQKSANRRARAELHSRMGLDDITEIEVEGHRHALLGSVDLGDVITLSGHASDWIEVDMQVRVLGITINPEDGKRAIYTVARTDRLIS